MLYFQDEARVGQKGRVCHRWWLRGQRPPGLVDQRYSFAYIFAAIEPASGTDFCLVLPVVSIAAMTEFLRRFSQALAANVHAALVVDGAGWHTSKELVVPDNITLIFLPPYAPQLNPVERVWLYLRERFLSMRLHADYHAILDAVCDAWQRITAERLRSLCAFPWIPQISS